MKLTIPFLVVFLLSAQNADVTILQPVDAKEALLAYHTMKDAQQKWDELTKRLKRVYAIQYEAEFSKDFKAVVPKSTSTAWADTTKSILRNAYLYYGYGALVCYPTGNTLTSNTTVPLSTGTLSNAITIPDYGSISLPSGETQELK